MKTHRARHAQLVISSLVLCVAGAPATADQVISDDLIVNGSTCVGLDCVNDESFGFATLVLKENNLRILFNDTSVSAEFPTQDWQLTANASTNGGASFFAIGQATDLSGNNYTTPFLIEPNVMNDTMYLKAPGMVGIGTNAPTVALDVNGDARIAGDLTVVGTITGTGNEADIQALQTAVTTLEGQVATLQGQIVDILAQLELVKTKKK